MAFVISGNVLARELWPQGIGRAIQDQRRMENLPAWCKVPTDLEGISRWAAIHSPDDGDGDTSRRHILVYRPEILVQFENPSMKFQIALRLQGYVKKLNIAALGNYRGRQDDPAKAIQYIVLEAQGQDEPFCAQTHALDDIRNMIKATIQTRSDLDNGSQRQRDDDGIYLRRRVFTRARGASGSQGIDLTAEDDPHRVAAKIKSNWIVSQRLVTRVQQPDGGLVTHRPFVFKPGDFVEVTVTADIVCLRKHGHMQVGVHFAMKELLRLKSVAELKAMGLTQDVVAARETFRDLPEEVILAQVAPLPIGPVAGGVAAGNPVDTGGVAYGGQLIGGHVQCDEEAGESERMPVG